MRSSVCVAAEGGKAERAGREMLREMSRSPSVEKERCSWQEPPEKGPTSQCRPCPHKTLQVCAGYSTAAQDMCVRVPHTLHTCRRAVEPLPSSNRSCEMCLHDSAQLMLAKGVQPVRGSGSMVCRESCMHHGIAGASIPSGLATPRQQSCQLFHWVQAYAGHRRQAADIQHHGKARPGSCRGACGDACKGCRNRGSIRQGEHQNMEFQLHMPEVSSWMVLAQLRRSAVTQTAGKPPLLGKIYPNLPGEVSASNHWSPVMCSRLLGFLQG